MSNPENEMTPQPFFDTKQTKCQIKWLHKIAAYTDPEIVGTMPCPIGCITDLMVFSQPLCGSRHRRIRKKKLTTARGSACYVGAAHTNQV